VKTCPHSRIAIDSQWSSYNALLTHLKCASWHGHRLGGAESTWLFSAVTETRSIVQRVQYLDQEEDRAYYIIAYLFLFKLGLPLKTCREVGVVEMGRGKPSLKTAWIPRPWILPYMDTL